MAAAHIQTCPGFVMQDIKASSKLEENIAMAWAGFLYAASTLHCMSVSLGQCGDGLGTVWGEQQALSMLDARASPESR